MWYQVTRNLQEFRGLMGCQRDPQIWGVTVTHLHLISNNFLPLQTPFSIALMATVSEGSYEVGERGGGGKFQKRPFGRSETTVYNRPSNAVRSPRNGWLSKVVYPASRLRNRLFNYAFEKPLPKPVLPPLPGSFLFPLKNGLDEFKPYVLFLILNSYLSRARGKRRTRRQASRNCYHCKLELLIYQLSL